MHKIFESTESYSKFFDEKLAELLRNRGGTEPGMFNTVCANACASPEERHRLWTDVSSCLDEMCRIQPELLEDEPKNADEVVFQEIVKIGLENIDVARVATIWPYQVQLNPIRALKPAYAASQARTSIFEDFDPEKFNFRAPQVEPLTIYEGEIVGKEAALVLNMFPFASKHVSLCPEIDAFHPQAMTEEIHYWLWEAIENLGRGICGIGCGFNSLGGYASVNHFHGQMFVEPKGLPVMLDEWRHNGGCKTYPAKLTSFENRDEAWAFIQETLDGNIAHNMLYTPGRVLVFRRRMQGTIAMPRWSGGIAWSELCGRMIVTDLENMQLANWDDIVDTLELVTTI
jgi:hypothetical protein